MTMFAKITQLGFAGSMLLTSLYMSLGFNDCDCDNARVYIPNQIVMIMGVLGVVFTVCNSGFKDTPFGHSSNTLIPGVIGLICSIIMLTADNKCDNCCDEEPCPEGKKIKCCVSKSKVLWAQLAISLVLAGWGSWSTIASYSKRKAIKAGKYAGKKAVAAGKAVKKKAVETKDNFAERMKKAREAKKTKKTKKAVRKKKLKKKAAAKAEGDDYSFSDFE
jgi:hypothetical protein